MANRASAPNKEFQSLKHNASWRLRKLSDKAWFQPLPATVIRNAPRLCAFTDNTPSTADPRE